MGEPGAAGVLVTLLPVPALHVYVGVCRPCPKKRLFSLSLDSQRTSVTFLWFRAGGVAPGEARSVGNLKFPGDKRKETKLLQRDRVREVRRESSRK